MCICAFVCGRLVAGVGLEDFNISSAQVDAGCP